MESGLKLKQVGLRICRLCLWEVPEGLSKNSFSGVVWSSQLTGGLWREGGKESRNSKGGCVDFQGLPKRGPQTGWLNQQEFIISVLEATHPKARCWQSCAPSEHPLREDPPCLFQFLVTPNISWLVAASLQLLSRRAPYLRVCVSLCIHMTFSLCVCVWVQIVPLLKGTSVIGLMLTLKSSS